MTPAFAGRPREGVRVMVVDDSVVARSMTVRWLQEQNDFEIVAVCRSGREAVDHVGWARPDVVVLDVEMPEMDGVEALPLLLRAQPGLAVVMASSFTTRGAELSLRCIALGAMEVVAKPGRDSQPDDYRRELIETVRTLGDVGRRRAAAAAGAAAGSAAIARHAGRSTAAAHPFEALVIGASTGGPQALAQVLRSLSPAIDRVPVLVAQHMPVGFTAALAGHIASACGVPAREARDGETLFGGTVYVAPGGRHLSIAGDRSNPIARLSDDPPVDFCRPSLDPLLRSAATVWGRGLVACVLTGMGTDGAGAAPAVAAAGGRVFAQDEATSVVWGMPGATVATGVCSAVLPLGEIGPRLAQLIAATRA